ncbi:uncharacterized protein LOC133869714 isoform X2 [Alnus glutinosa]|uniref:uncharacterized protein LOC133869714 isoform X2 n=1 Tax=Alnus glutinosa TaxID=3517 RepID=UPI002D78C35F|nr:uncharacterized protein LOC133869714 isoform X2 [Alnus glutinosa]
MPRNVGVSMRPMGTRAWLKQLLLPWWSLKSLIFYSIMTLLYKEAKWKVFFNNDFQKSIARTSNVETRKEVLFLLAKLSSGWRRPHKVVHDDDGTSSQLLEMYKVDGQLNLVWTVDILKEDSYHIQGNLFLA